MPCMNYTRLTLGELLSSANDTIKRNALSILKQLQRAHSEAHTLTVKHDERHTTVSPTIKH